MQVRAIWADLMAIADSPEAAAALDPAAIEPLLRPQGLSNVKARAIVAMSTDFLKPDWRRPSELRHIGKYASDAYFLFCRCASSPCKGHDMFNFAAKLRRVCDQNDSHQEGSIACGHDAVNCDHSSRDLQPLTVTIVRF